MVKFKIEAYHSGKWNTIHGHGCQSLKEAHKYVEWAQGLPFTPLLRLMYERIG